MRDGNSSVVYELAKRATTSQDAVPPSNDDTEEAVSMNLVGEMTTVEWVTGRENALLVKEDDDLFEVDERTEAIEVRDGVCGDCDIQKWDLSECKRLVELVVGNGCVEYVRELRLVGFARLERVVIGANCFCKSDGGCFEASGCEKLKRVVVGDGCCVKWSEFVLRDCDSLQEVSVGDGCFVRCEKVVFESEYC